MPSASAATTNSSQSLGAGDQRLGAVEDPVARPSSARRGLQLQRVEQRPRLEDRQRRGGHVLAGEGGQVGGLLLGAAPVADRGGDGAGGERRVGDAHVAVGERLADQDAGHRGLLVHDAAELLGDAEHVDAELGGLRRAARPASRSRRRPRARPGGPSPRRRRGRASWNICCSSSGLRSKRPVDLLVLLARRFAQLLGRLEGAPGGGRRAEAVLGALEERPLDLLADADAVEQVRAGEAVERPQAEAHAALGDSLVAVGGGVTSSSRLWIWLGGFTAVEVRCAALGVAHGEVDLARPRRRCANSTRPGSRIGLRKRDVDGEGVGQAASSAARQRALVHIPCAIAPREAERLRGQRVHVDRVAVAGDGARSGGRGRRRASTRRWPAASASAPSPACARRSDFGASPVAACRGAASCWSLSQTSSLAGARLGDAGVKVRPLGCGSSGVGADRAASSSSPMPIGRCWTIRFSRWTRPTAPNGKPPSAITAMCSGKASTCG